MPDCDGCGRNPKAHEPPRPRKVIILESADGLRSPRPITVDYLGLSYTTAYVPISPATRVGEGDRPQDGGILRQRVYRHRGKMDFSGPLPTEVWQEVVDPPPNWRTVPKDKVESIISSLTAEATRRGSQGVNDRINGNTHLAVTAEATAQALTNVVIKLKALVKGE